MNSEVLITGISGFVGQNLYQYLKRHNELKITGTSRDKSKIEFLEKEINQTFSNDELLQNSSNFDTYVHLSGKVHNLRDKDNEEEYIKANFELTKRFFDRFLSDEKAKKFIFLSTIHVLAENPTVTLDESYSPKPFTPYGRSKYKAEKYIRNYSRPDKKYYILRPGMIHGPGNKGNLNTLYHLVNKGLPYPVGAINNKRSFVSIENLCFAINELIQNDVKQGLYHIADEDPVHTHDLVRKIAEIAGRKARIWSINPFLLQNLAKLGNIIPIGINEHRLNKLTHDFIISNKKIKKALDKEFPISAEEGLIRTLKEMEKDF